MMAGMKRFFRRAVFAAFIPASLVCAAPVASADAGKVAVVSLLGDVFPSTRLGSTAMSKKRYRTRVAPWRLDDYVRGVVTDVLRREGRLQPVNFRPNRKTFMQVYTDEFRLLDDKNYDLDKIRGAVRALRSKYKADTLILILADRVTDPIEESSTEFSGYGLYRHDFILDRSYLYGFFRVLAMDTRTLEEKAQATVAAHTTVDRKFWSPGLNRLPQAARRALRGMTRRLLAANLTQALADAGLVAHASVAAPAGQTEEDGIEMEMVGVDIVPPGGDSAGYQDSYEDGDTRRHTGRDDDGHAGGYEAAARRLFLTLSMETAFNRYALDYVQNRVLGKSANVDLYRDVCQQWVLEHFRWPVLKKQVVAIYRRMGFNVRDLAEIADFGGSATGGKVFAGDGFTAGAGQREIWRRVASGKRLKGLRTAVAARKRLILREAENLAK